MFERSGPQLKPSKVSPMTAPFAGARDELLLQVLFHPFQLTRVLSSPLRLSEFFHAGFPSPQSVTGVTLVTFNDRNYPDDFRQEETCFIHCRPSGALTFSDSRFLTRFIEPLNEAGMGDDFSR